MDKKLSEELKNICTSNMALRSKEGHSIEHIINCQIDSLVKGLTTLIILSENQEDILARTVLFLESLVNNSGNLREEAFKAARLEKENEQES